LNLVELQYSISVRGAGKGFTKEHRAGC
jgi:hypothetical protein